MLYAVTISYVRPPEEVDAHLDTHRDWLVRHSKAGRIIVAGPLEPRIGGFLLVQCNSRAELDTMLAEDSYAVHKVATSDIRAFSPALRLQAFPATWAPEAKGI